MEKDNQEERYKVIKTKILTNKADESNTSSYILAVCGAISSIFAYIGIINESILNGDNSKLMLSILFVIMSGISIKDSVFEANRDALLRKKKKIVSNNDEERYKVTDIKSLHDDAIKEGRKGYLFGIGTITSILGSISHYYLLQKDPYSLAHFLLIFACAILSGVLTKKMVTCASREADFKHKRYMLTVDNEVKEYLKK